MKGDQCLKYQSGEIYIFRVKHILCVVSILIVATIIQFFCTNPVKPNFSVPEPFKITLFIDSTGNKILNTGDTLQMENTLHFGLETNRSEDIDTIALVLKDPSGDTLHNFS